jgi:hypothetical protein
VALGLEFVDTYAVQITTKAYGVPTSKPQLLIPTPKSFCHPRVQKKWQAGWRWYNNCVPASFVVGPERYSTSVVDPPCCCLLNCSAPAVWSVRLVFLLVVQCQ